MKALFVTYLHDISLSESVDTPVEIYNGVYITDSFDYLLKMVGYVDNFKVAIGDLEYQSFEKSSAYLFKEIWSADDNFDYDGTLSKLMVDIDRIRELLWFCRDNSVNCIRGYLVFGNDDMVHISYQPMELKYTNAKGTYENTNLTMQDLHEIYNIKKKLIYSTGEYPVFGKTVLMKRWGRIDIAGYHVQNARAEIDLAIKIMQYVISLESIFSTTNYELSHQVSERVAFFIGKSGEERLKIYKLIKKGYAIRSTVSHGGRFKKEGDLEKVCVEIDHILRLVFKEILQGSVDYDFFNNDEKLNEYFLNLILGIKAD